MFINSLIPLKVSGRQTQRTEDPAHRSVAVASDILKFLFHIIKLLFARSECLTSVSHEEDVTVPLLDVHFPVFLQIAELVHKNLLLFNLLVQFFFYCGLSFKLLITAAAF